MDFFANKDLGLFVIRVGIGLIFIKHGWDKITGGPQVWTNLGRSMQNFGITFMPVLWGLLATGAEFFGGIALTIGLCVPCAAALMACVMIVALVMHIKKGDSFEIFSHPLSLLCVFIGLMLAGGGSYSIR